MAVALRTRFCCTNVQKANNLFVLDSMKKKNIKNLDKNNENHWRREGFQRTYRPDVIRY